MKLNKEFKFKKRYGQNFLKDKTIINKIIEKSEIETNTLVIEIGPGSGELTKEIAPLAKNVVSFEIDKTLESTLNQNLKEFDNIDIIYEDFLKIDVKSIINKYNYEKLYVIANLPYYITTPIITKIIDSKLDVDKMIIMVQKEVGERFCAKKNCREYGSITVYLNYYFNIEKVIEVPRRCFIPEPNVDSVVIKMSKKYEKYDVDEKILFKLIKDSFQFKRKNLNNNLKQYKNIKNIFNELNIELTKRAEELDLNDYIKIAKKLQ